MMDYKMLFKQFWKKKAFGKYVISPGFCHLNGAEPAAIVWEFELILALTELLKNVTYFWWLL